jgi:hypothetical protein
MALTCRKCSRVNPVGAFYCYYDGNVLGKAGRQGGPVSTGSAPFPSAFVLPSGKACHNFDELALACNEDWTGAKQLLEKGYLESFLGGLGRIDLAGAAREAANFPDRDRGLDQFLARLPTQSLEPPRLRAEPLEVSLGVVQAGQDRSFELRLENQGMRLLYGSVTVDGAPWMVLGSAPGAPEKIFGFCDELVIPVHVKGKQLRANAKPQEGRLVIESNGGSFTVVVKIEVPVKPYPDGPLAGAKSPRQVAEKAKANPKEAAVYFEKGHVAKWYEANGWTYPVQGPSASGLGAVQQFFEALGLTPAPKVQIDQAAVTLSGQPGANLRHTLEVSTPEKKPIYAHGVSDESWLEVGRPKLNGRTATIPLVVPAVPNKPGQKLKANVTVTSNGNQRFVVPVTLTVMESFDFTSDAPPPPVEEESETIEAAVAAPAPSRPAPVVEDEPPRTKTPRPRAPRGSPLHLVPAVLLLLALLGVAGFDVFFKPQDAGSSSGSPASGPRVWKNLADTTPRIQVLFRQDNLRFGIVMPGEKEEGTDSANATKAKRLTRYEDGQSSNVCVKIDNYEYLWGTVQSAQTWEKGKKQHANQKEGPWRSTFKFPEDVYVTQTVEIVPGEQTRLLDTCLVQYTIENRSNTFRTVGLRVMLDTYIYPNDGAPFVVPGIGLVNTKKTLTKTGTTDIPDYIQVLEKPDLKNPGTVVHIGLSGFTLPDEPGVAPEPLEKVLLTRWPEAGFTKKWDVDEANMNEPPENPDSCVVLYWPTIKMNPHEKRVLAYTYGLNRLSGESSGNAKLSLTSGGSFRPGNVFTVTAYVNDATKGQAIDLKLPEGLELVEGEQPSKKITEDAAVAQVAWKIRSKKAGDFALEVFSGGVREVYKVAIREGGLF